MILKKTDKTIKSFEKEIKRLLKEGKTAKEAVDEAYKKCPVLQVLEKELQKQLEEEMNRGAGEELPISAIHDALSMVWSPDKLSLSERTTKGGKEITKRAAAIIADAIKQGKTVQKTALSLFDGYGYGHVLPTQDIPEFMKKLAEIGRLSGYRGWDFQKTLRSVERQLKRVNTQGMKIAYNKIKEAVEDGNEKKIDKAIYVATQERTRYFARRIARTELARAYGDGAMAKWENDEDCVAFQWKLSTGHPFYDICDLYAHADLYGMGPGIFPKDKVPRLPVHPNCMCHLRPVMEGSKLLQGKEKEQIDESGMAYIKTLDKHNQERLLGVYGRLGVLKSGNWTGKARGYSAGYMQSRIKEDSIAKLVQFAQTVDIKTATEDDIRLLGNKINEVFKIDEHLGEKEYIKQAISHFREMGGVLGKEQWATGCSRENKKQLEEAFSYYPKAWADYLINSQKKIYTVKVRRGFFSGGAVAGSGTRYQTKFGNYKTGFVSIHMSGIRETTPFHELGHYVEYMNKDVLRITKEFLARRTAGEKTVLLKDIYPGSNYSSREVTKKDNFISPYIGKEYNAATEVFSVGLESIFAPTKDGMLKRVDKIQDSNGNVQYKPIYAKIKKDKEHLNLVLGLLAKG